MSISRAAQPSREKLKQLLLHFLSQPTTDAAESLANEIVRNGGGVPYSFWEPITDDGGREIFPKAILFSSPATGSTLALSVNDVLQFGAGLVRAHIADSDAKFAEPKPRLDVEVENHGSIFIFRPLTPAAEDFIEENVSREGFHPNWPTLTVESRYAANLAEGMKQSGLVVGGAA